MTNSFGANIFFPILGIAGILTFSIFPSKILRSLMGIGIFGLSFTTALIISRDINISMSVGIVAAIIVVSSFDWLLKTDLYSAVLIIILALLGSVILLTIIPKWWVYQYHSSHVNKSIIGLKIDFNRVRYEIRKVSRFYKKYIKI